MDRDLFYNSYVQTYLQRDVRDLANVGNLTSFLRFIRAAAARTGQLLTLPTWRVTPMCHPTPENTGSRCWKLQASCIWCSPGM